MKTTDSIMQQNLISCDTEHTSNLNATHSHNGHNQSHYTGP